MIKKPIDCQYFKRTFQIESSRKFQNFKIAFFDTSLLENSLYSLKKTSFFLKKEKIVFELERKLEQKLGKELEHRKSNLKKFSSFFLFLKI